MRLRFGGRNTTGGKRQNAALLSGGALLCADTHRQKHSTSVDVYFMPNRGAQTCNALQGVQWREGVVKDSFLALQVLFTIWEGPPCNALHVCAPIKRGDAISSDRL